MFNQQNAQRQDEEYDMEDEATSGGSGLRSRFARWRAFLTGHGAEDEDDDAYEDTAAVRPVSGGTQFVGTRAAGAPTVQSASAPTTAATAARNSTFRIASAREGSITVMPVCTFADVQKAADRLKAGEPQIVNLEKTDAEIAERLIDFLNGVTYALDGYVEKVAEGAYLFTPSHIAIHADGPAEQARSKNFLDRIS